MDIKLNKEKIIAWFSAGRFIFMPWMLLNTLFGAVLAGFEFYKWLMSFILVFSVLTMGHFLNDWRDFVLGRDKLNDGSNVKPYTEAQQVLPKGLLSLNTIKMSTIIFALISLLFFIRISFEYEMFVIFLLGVFISITYTDIGKSLGIGEIYLFFGHGFSTTCFSYVYITRLDMVGIFGGIILGFWAAFSFTLDQWQDIDVDLSNGIKTLAARLKSRRVGIRSVWIFILFGNLFLQIIAVFVFSFSYLIFISLFLYFFAYTIYKKMDEDLDLSLLLILLFMWLNTILMMVGILLS